MNFSPFSTHFPGIHQFVTNTTSQSLDTNNANRYQTTTINTSNANQFNQSQLLGKFRTDNDTNNMLNTKYNPTVVTSAQYGTVSYAQPTESKDNRTTVTSNSNYQTLSQAKDTITQIQHSDLTQDLTALLQQTDTKKGKIFVIKILLIDHVMVPFFCSFTKCEYKLADINNTSYISC